MNKVTTILHHGKQILCLDFSYCSVDEFFQIMEEAKNVIRNQPHNSVLTLTDVMGARYNSNVIQALKEFTKENKPFVKAGAVVGLDGLKMIIYNSVMHFSGRALKAFDEKEKAKNWLIEQREATHINFL